MFIKILSVIRITIKCGYAYYFTGFIVQVADINPLGSINTAMKRIPPGWENAWTSSECIKLTDALHA